MNQDPHPAINDQHPQPEQLASTQESPSPTSPELVQELIAAREALELSRREWEADVRHKQEEFKAMAKELAKERSDLEGLQRGMDASSEQTVKAEEEAYFQPVSECAPVDAASVLSKFKSPADEELDAVPSPLTVGASHAHGSSHSRDPHGPPIKIQGQASLHSSHHTPEDEESLQKYMAEMMKRVRGENGLTVPTAPVRVTPKTATERKPEPLEAIQQAKHQPERLSELPIRRKLPPELTSDLSAMRALANQSAQTALDSHIRSRWVQAGWGKASVALCGLLSGLLLLYWSDHLGDYSVIPAGLSFMVFLFWGLQALIVLAFAYRNDFSPRRLPPRTWRPPSKNRPQKPRKMKSSRRTLPATKSS